jgi:integral membrane protein
VSTPDTTPDRSPQYSRHSVQHPLPEDGREAPAHLRGALLRYRVMATVVGVLLIVLILVGVPLKYLAGDGSDPQQLGEWITTYLGVAHGWLYMIFLVTAFWLSRKAGWELPFTIVTLLCGTVPVLSFWAEHRATARVRHDAPADAVPGPAAGSR